ncbi:hypothetical protein AB0G15_05715 [Streptosporangium sp. NPDC023825]|uniref:hypothetical protein n=1 Tax=Streptosporangium sp. NPDC023825 TaxID=3154909 RepID=UPI0034457BEB
MSEASAEISPPPRMAGFVFMGITHAGDDQCSMCGTLVIEAEFRDPNWTPPWYVDPEEANGGGVYRVLLHADGAPGHGENNDFISKKNRCANCRGFNVSYEETGYGTIARCGDCGHAPYYDRGD